MKPLLNSSWCRLTLFRLALFGSAIISTACASEGAEEVADPGEMPVEAGSTLAMVMILQSRFDPLDLEVESPTTIAFTNLDPYAHTITSKDESDFEFDSGELAEGNRAEVTFDEPGVFIYFCEIHPTMRASVTVE